MVSSILFNCNCVQHYDFRTTGVPIVRTEFQKGSIKIGHKFAMNNRLGGNYIGYASPCMFVVNRNSHIIIGENVGISQCALVAKDADINIGSNVKIGGGTNLYTSDFHSIIADIRRSNDDLKHRKSAPITIGDDVFIGAGCIILKGVSIGNCSIVGAGSVVTKSIPSGEIWGGNPARFIRKIDNVNNL